MQVVTESHLPIEGIGRDEQRLETAFRQRRLFLGAEFDFGLGVWNDERGGITTAGENGDKKELLHKRFARQRKTRAYCTDFAARS